MAVTQTHSISTERSLHSLLLLFTLLSTSTHAFVLQGTNGNEAVQSLPAGAFRWSVPSGAHSRAGLGGGLDWVLADDFCNQMLGQFAERDLVRFANYFRVDIPWAQFVHCTDIRDAISRGFATWTANHRLITFNELGSTAACKAQGSVTGEISDACPWELHIGTANGTENRELAAYVINHRVSALRPDDWYNQPVRSSAGVVTHGVDAYARSVMRFQTHLCWYLDATFCYYFQRLQDEHNVDVLLITRAVLLVVFGVAALRILAILFWCFIALCCLKSKHSELKLKKRGACPSGCSALLDYLASLSPCGLVLFLFLFMFPPIFYDRIFMPCFECYDFEAAVAHETGHVLGFGHPDVRATENLVGACNVTNATCQSPFDCAAQLTYTEEGSERSIMHSLTRHAPRTCLSQEDMHGLYFLYPLCDELQPTTVSCVKGRRLSGWLRLAIVVGVPFFLAILVTIVPLTCLRWRDQRRMRQLDKEVGRAQDEILEYRVALTKALRSTVRDAIARPATALQNASRAVSRSGSRRGGRVAPEGGGSRPAPAAAGNKRPGAAATGKRGGGELKLEDVAEEEAAAKPQPKPARKLPAPGQTGKPAGAPTPSKSTPSKAAAPSPAGAGKNGYTGPAWPEKDAKPKAESGGRRGRG